MKILLVALLLVSSIAVAEDFKVTVDEVYDGDTFKTRLDSLPVPLNKVSIRFLGIDTPEKGGRAKCPEEAALAIEALDYLKQVLKPGSIVTLKNYSWDKFGGRILAEPILNGQSLSVRMINAGYAKPYFGTGDKFNWCSGKGVA